MKRFAALLCILCISSHLLFSQSPSPFSLSLKADIPLTAAGIVVLGIGTHSDFTHRRRWITEAEFESLNRLKVCGDTCALLRTSILADRVSDGLLFGTLLLALQTTLLMLPAESENGKDRITYGVMIAQTFAINQGVTDIFKNYIRRPRPYSYYRSKYPTFADLQAANNFGDVNRSFFSGHTSTTAAFSFLTANILSANVARKTDKIIIWSAGALVPAVTGYLRVRAAKHFPVDVMVGYAVGAAIGFGVAELHKK
jgi:membrane-associated phospholipid phosphatase